MNMERAYLSASLADYRLSGAPGSKEVVMAATEIGLAMGHTGFPEEPEELTSVIAWLICARMDLERSNVEGARKNLERAMRDMQENDPEISDRAVRRLMASVRP